MFQPCTITSCKRISCAICHCCSQNICQIHFNEHLGALNSKLNPLIDEINALEERLQTLNTQKKIDYCRHKLEQWRKNCYQKIDQLFEEKCHELDELAAVKIAVQTKEISQVRENVAQLNKDQAATPRNLALLTSHIRCLQGKMQDIEQTAFQINIRPLIIDNSSITFKEKREHQFDPAIGYPIHKTLEYTPDSWFPLASNEHHLLCHRYPNLCFINRELNIVRQIHWPYGIILNMCWSPSFNGFIILTTDTIYLIDDRRFIIRDLLSNSKRNWLACTCSDLYLFVSTNEWGSSVLQYISSTTIEFNKQWQTPKSCGSDERIESMVYNNDKLALTIRNRFERSIRIELRFSEPFDRIWSLRLDQVPDLSKIFQCCSLACDEWLVINSQNGQLLHITKSGTSKANITYRYIPQRINFFNENFLVIATNDGLKFHRLKSDN